MPGLTYTIADLIRQRGQTQANALREQANLRAQQQRASGQGWGQAIADIGHTIATIPAQRRQQQLQQQQDEVNALTLQEKRGELADKQTARQRAEAFQAVLAKHQSIDEAVNDPALMQADPERYSDLLNKHVLPARKAAEDERARKNNFIASQLGGAEDQGTWTKAVYTVGQVYPDAVADLPEDFEQAKPIIKSKLRTQLSPKDQLEQMQKEQAPKGFTNETQLYAAAADPNDPRHDVAQAALAMKEKPAKGAAVGSFEDYVVRKYGDSPTPEQITEARKTYMQADDRPRITVNAGGGEGVLTPDAVEYTATAYRLLGTRAIPTRISGAERAKILNEAARQSKTLGQSPASATIKQLTVKADSTALSQVQKMASSAEAFESKALGQADIISNLSQKVNRTQWPIINAALQAGREHITGDENATKLANAINTFSAEYAKIMEGSTGSSAASSDAARKASARLINTAMNKGTMASVLELMKQEMRLTLQGYDVAKESITTRIGGAPAVNTVNPTGRFNPATGKVEPIK